MQTRSDKIELIKKARRRTKLSQSDFAALMNVTLPSVWRYEAGKLVINKKYFWKCQNILLATDDEVEIFIDAFKKRRVFLEATLKIRIPEGAA